MKIVLFGATGFVGSHLLSRLARDGHQLTVVTRNRARHRALGVTPGVRLVQGDPHDAAWVAATVEGHEAVVNLVGILNERGFGGKGFRRVHVELPRKLIDACERHGVRRMLHMSALNAGQGQSHYLRSKGAGEDLVRHAPHVDATVFRPAVIFGSDDSFLNRFAGLLKISPVLPLARPRARLSPVYVGDVVEAFAQALTRRETIGQALELCGPETWSLIEIVRWIRSRLKLKRLIMGLPDWAGWLQGRVFDFVPGKPFSSDNFTSLKQDGVCRGNDFGTLGIKPHSMSRLAPTWMRGGRQQRLQKWRSQYAEVPGLSLSNPSPPRAGEETAA